LEQFGIDYVHKRNKIINCVSFKATKGAAKSMLNVDELTIVILGQPKVGFSKSVWFQYVVRFDPVSGGRASCLSPILLSCFR